MVQLFRSLPLFTYHRASAGVVSRHGGDDNDDDNDNEKDHERQEEGNHQQAAHQIHVFNGRFRVTTTEDKMEKAPSPHAGIGGADSDDGNKARSMDPAEVKELHVLLRIFGRSYASNCHFWFRLVPLSILMGALVGTMGMIFLGSYRWILCQWVAATSSSSSSNSNLVDALGEDGVKFGAGRVAWIGITSLGGFLVGVVRVLPGAPTTMTRTMFHDTMNLSGHLGDAPYILLAAFLSLCAGAPLGPEMSVGTLGSFLASLLARKACCFMDGSRRRRSEAALVLAGLAASLGGLFGNPLLSVLLIHELSVVSRPGDDLTLDGLMEKEKLEGRREEDMADQGGIVATLSSNDDSSSLSKSRDHDYMEQVSLTGIAATLSFVCFRGLMSLANVDVGRGSEEDGDISNDHSSSSIMPLVYAIPLGLLCGVLATLFLIWNGVFKTIRVKLSARLEKSCARWFSSWHGLVPLASTTLAGAWFGCLAMAFPLILGSGAELLADFSSLSQQLPAWYLATTGMVKLLATASCLGLGLVGGQLFPSAFAGACVGAALSKWFPFLETKMTVACCMVAVPGSFIPIPLTLVLFVALEEKNVNLMAPMLVSTLVAFAVNGGSGFVGRMAQRKLTNGAGVDTATASPRTKETPELQGEWEKETVMSYGSSFSV